MSELINSWIDPNEMKRLSESLLKPIPEADVISRSDSEEGLSPIQREASASLQKAQEAAVMSGAVRPRPPKIQEGPRVKSPSLKGGDLKRVPESSLTLEQAKSLKAQDLVRGHVARRPTAPSGELPLLQRVKDYGGWLRDAVGAEAFFVCNLEGRMMVDGVKNKRVVELARSLVSASRKGLEKKASSELKMKLGDSVLLQVVLTPSQYGILILGIVLKDLLCEEGVKEVRLGLTEVADARLLNR